MYWLGGLERIDDDDVLTAINVVIHGRSAACWKNVVERTKRKQARHVPSACSVKKAGVASGEERDGEFLFSSPCQGKRIVDRTEEKHAAESEGHVWARK